MDKQLRRILDLVRKTGDRMVVTDTNGDDVYVVMGLEQYEALVDLGSDDFDYSGVDKPEVGPYSGGDFEEPERDLPEEYYAPRPSSEGPSATYTPPSAVDTSTEPPDIWDLMQPAGAEGSTWDLEKLTGAERKDLEKQFVEYQQRKAEEESRIKAQESKKVEEVKETKKEEEFGEEQFYLEPIE